MAAPSFVAASTGATDASGDWTATCHAPGAADRIIILHLVQDGANTLEAISTFTNVKALDGTNNSMTKIAPNVNTSSQPWVGAAPLARHQIWIGRSTSTSAPTAAGTNASGDDLYWRFYEFQNVNAGATLASVIENGPVFFADSGMSPAFGSGIYSLCEDPSTGRIVFGGASGAMKYTDNLTSWTAVTSPGFGTEAIQAIATDGTTWVAGSNTGSIRYATDPTGTWSAASSPGFGTSGINSIFYDSASGYWVAGADGGKIRYATDPTGTWTAASSPGFTFGVYCVYKYGSTWYATSLDTSNQIRYTTDPTGTWTAASSPGFGTSGVYSIRTNGTTWIAVGGNGKIRYATDPTGTWTAVSSIGGGSSVFYAIATDGTTWFVGGNGTTQHVVTNTPQTNWGKVSGHSLGWVSPVNGAHYSSYWGKFLYLTREVGTVVTASAPSQIASRESDTSGTILAPTVMTYGPDRLALAFVAGSDDNPLDAFTGEAGGDWTEVTAEYATATGTDAVLGLQSSAMATATTLVGGSDAWVDATDGWGVLAFALIGTTVAGVPRHGFVNHQEPGVFAKALDRIRRRPWLELPVRRPATVLYLRRDPTTNRSSTDADARTPRLSRRVRALPRRARARRGVHAGDADLHEVVR